MFGPSAGHGAEEGDALSDQFFGQRPIARDNPAHPLEPGGLAFDPWLSIAALNEEQV
nr:hypothetical protein [Pararhodobacter sp.]